jgi:hypothetical protein
MSAGLNIFKITCGLALFNNWGHVVVVLIGGHDFSHDRGQVAREYGQTSGKSQTQGE